MDNIEIYEKPFTDKEFDQLNKIELSFYDRMRDIEQERYEISLKILTVPEVEFVKKFDKWLYDYLVRRPIEWKEQGLHKQGLSNIKNMYFIGYFRSLIPILFKHHTNLTSKEIKMLFDPIKFNGFLKQQYPHMIDFFKDMNSLYVDYRIELKKTGLDKRVDYRNLSSEPWKGYSMSIITQLWEKIKAYKTKNKNKGIERKIMELSKKGMKQVDIAKKLDISQGRVSKIIKK